MGRKYLNDIGIKDKDLPWKLNPGDKRTKEWQDERKVYGFDERDTWTLRYTLTILVYERLKYYREFAPVEMDTAEWNSYTFEGKDIVFGAAIDRILKSFEAFVVDDDEREEVYKEYQKCWALLGVIMPGLWW